MDVLSSSEGEEMHVEINASALLREEHDIRRTFLVCFVWSNSPFSPSTYWTVHFNRRQCKLQRNSLSDSHLQCIGYLVQTKEIILFIWSKFYFQMQGNIKH